MIKVVIDTGIVVSAAFRNRTPEQLILFIAESDDFEWVVSSAILTEYNEVLARKKFGLDETVLSEWRETFYAFTTLVETDVSVDFARDRKDAKFLECALASRAEFLIASDEDFEEARELTETTIISISRFITTFMTGDR